MKLRLLVPLALLAEFSATAFTSLSSGVRSSPCAYHGRSLHLVPSKAPQRRRARARSSPLMLFGPQENFFGVGGPELAVVLIVGYFVLGPTELYRVSKQAGQFLGSLKDIGLGTVTNFQSIMETQLKEAEKMAANGGIMDLDSKWGNSDEDEEEEEYEDLLIDENGDIVLDTPAPPQPKWVQDAEEKAAKEKAEADAEFANSKFSQQLDPNWNDMIMSGEAEDMGPQVSGDWGNVPQDLSADDSESADAGAPKTDIDLQFERLEKLAGIEDERVELMNKVEAAFETRIRQMKAEVMEIVDEDYKAKREALQEEYRSK